MNRPYCTICPSSEEPTTSFALCNYNSRDDLDSYVGTRLKADIKAGKLLYFHTTSPRPFDASKAKNVAHRLALMRKPCVVFNLDADNYLSPQNLDSIVGAFSLNPDCFFHGWSQTWRDGSFGRIGMLSSNLERLGGYDESLPRMGWVDMDLLLKARSIGLSYHAGQWAGKASIDNSFMQKVENLGVASDDEANALIAFKNLSSDNMQLAFARPVEQNIELHERYSGTLNFAEAFVL